MEMGSIKNGLLLVFMTLHFNTVSCCEISGIANQWVDLEIIDTDRGIVFQGNATDVASITTATHSGDDLNFGPYFTATLEGSVFTLTLSDNYELYEEYETTQSMSYSVTFSCSTSGSLSVVFIVSVTDTNNNAPVFIDADNLTYTITTPLSIGYLVTGCDGYIAVRDIDLTTQSIEFTIEENPYFEIVYDSSLTTEDKTFGAIVRTTGVVKSLTETLNLTIYATDVDQTGDDPLTTSATLSIVPNAEFQYPDEPIFSQTYYIGSYTEDNELIFEDTIYLKQGYDTNVTYNLTGDYADYFAYQATDNEVSILLTSAVPSDVLAEESQIYLVLCAEREYTSGDCVTLIIQTPSVSEILLTFDQTLYEGKIEDGNLEIADITLVQGYEDGFSIILEGDYAEYFTTSITNNNISVAMNDIDNNVLESISFILLELTANSTTSTAVAIIVLEVVTDDIVAPLFDKLIYTGNYSSQGMLEVEEIVLSQGYDSTVTLSLEGDYSSYFTLEHNNSIINLQVGVIPNDIVDSETQILLSVIATKNGTSGANAAVVISLPTVAVTTMLFQQSHYLAKIENNELILDTVVLTSGYSNNVEFSLIGDYATSFNVTNAENEVIISLDESNFDSSLLDNSFLILTLLASGSNNNATTTIVLDLTEESATIIAPLFSSILYAGYYANSSYFEMENITLSQGYNENVTFTLTGELSEYFSVSNQESIISLSVISDIPLAVIYDVKVLLFTITANKPMSLNASSVVYITFPRELTELTLMEFSKGTYEGYLTNNSFSLETILLETGYEENTDFALSGEHVSYFTLTNFEGEINITISSAIPDQILQDFKYTVLELNASRNGAISATATIVIDFVSEGDCAIIPVFSEAYYKGTYSNDSLEFDELISLAQGYSEGVTFELQGDESEWFAIQQDGNLATLVVSSEITDSVIGNRTNLLFFIVATTLFNTTGDVAISIDLPSVYFSSALYAGVVGEGQVQHETITIYNYKGTEISLVGDYSDQFSATLSSGVVTVEAGSLVLSDNTTYISLEIRAGTANTVLVFDVNQTDETIIPTVVFTASTYQVTVDIIQTGLVGRVQASADTGETVIYTLVIEDDNLSSRLWINTDGELYLSAPASSGVYYLEVVATTYITQVSATASIQLTVNAVTVCGTDDNMVLPPLIVLKRDEEEPHESLVTLNDYDGCWFNMTNKWPINQQWLYINESGLHTIAIDREDASIAFMAQSQIQIELVLECEDDETVSSRRKRSLGSNLGPYDYGSNDWILTETILYNSRRSFVNLIVNDINDNAPVFVGKDVEPLAFGYPVDELLSILRPRSFAELNATDADIGINAELVYWSSDSMLAVSPTSGIVHFADNHNDIEDGAVFTVNVTDQAGAGMTSSIQIMVRLIDQDHIAIVTIRGVFIEDELEILNNLTDTLGYDVRVINSFMISEDYVEESGSRLSRSYRDVTEGGGASLQLYVYGLVDTEVVAVDTLISDISTKVELSSLNITTTVSLQDYLEALEIGTTTQTGRDIGLLIATIVLSSLLFILIVTAAVWYFLKWRKERNYDGLSEENSITSRNESLDTPKPETLGWPKPNIEEIKRTERRLQEMLDEPKNKDLAFNSDPPQTVSFVDSKETKTQTNTQQTQPIVIQSIDKLKTSSEGDDDDDEFGEKNSEVRRKSVVTFNENVEKIIHVVDNTDDTDSQYDLEIERL